MRGQKVLIFPTFGRPYSVVSRVAAGRDVDLPSRFANCKVVIFELCVHVRVLRSHRAQMSTVGTRFSGQKLRLAGFELGLGLADAPVLCLVAGDTNPGLVEKSTSNLKRSTNYHGK
jgi:hypothetical protein